MTTWTPWHAPMPTVGSTVHIETATSRRAARVIGTKPGHVLLSYQI